MSFQRDLPIKALKILQDTLIQKGQTLAVAESCTGGLLSSWITEQAGASRYFKGAVVSYDTQVKIDVLNLDSQWAQKKGVVNEKTAETMARSVKNLLKSDWGVSITGIAGPSVGFLGEPVGQVAFSVCSPFATHNMLKKIEGKNRQEVRHQSALFALDFLLSELK